jgi:D-serine deaminase-like pyridoxal phosphate-dependent protein
VFYDLTQYRLGACEEDEIAVAVACPVVGKYPIRKQIVLYGGAVHLSKEFISDDQGNRIYGYVARVDSDSLGRIDLRSPVISLSQEHGIVQADGVDFNEIHIGDLMYVIPVHSCLTANLYREYVTLDGDTIGKL